jgi:type IV pilus assembly protein PilF
MNPWLLLTVVLLGGCVTTQVGGLPKPGSVDQRVQAQLDLARGYLEQRDIARARRPLETALKIDPTSAEANVLMAAIYQIEGEDRLAEAAYKKAIRHSPRNSMARNNYGSFLFAKERYADARKELTIAVEDTTYSARPQAYENLGLTELKLGLREDAERSLQRALMLNSRQARSMLELAEIYYDKGLYPQARQYFDGYVREAKHTPRSLWLGIRLSRIFNDANALSSYALALKNLYPGSEEYQLYQQGQQ